MMRKLSLSVTLLLIVLLSYAQLKQVNKPVKDISKLQKIILPNLNYIKGCRDLPLSAGYAIPPRAATNNYPIYKIDENGIIGSVAVQRQPLGTVTEKMWEPGRVLKVGFNISGAPIDIIYVVQRYAIEWERYANIKFEFVQNMATADIRIGFLPNGSYSYIGREALLIPTNATTMNLGWLTSASDAEARRVVLHEFGHALGFIHEHSSPTANIPYDREKVYAYYALPPNSWDRATVDRNLFQKYSVSETNYSTYDPGSIMHYVVPPELTTNGIGVPFNTELSSVDKQYAGYFYPFPATPATATGTLKTGDYCDRVDFKVEYNVVPNDKVEFVFTFGKYNNKAVTWWKQIGIPGPGNTESILQIQNHSLIASENKTLEVRQFALNQINFQRPIRFWKAKGLGIHTLLSYQWNILPAIRGGCRITLVWSRDSCLQ